MKPPLYLPVDRHVLRPGLLGSQDLHTVDRNASKTKPAKFLEFLLKDKGKPPVILAH
jgi:hypothetical protein